MPTVINATTRHQIYVGKGNDYVVFKPTSQATVYLMAVCDTRSYFDNNTFTCEPCNPSHNSFGNQMGSCKPCNTLMLTSKQDPLNYAIYTQLCTDGQFKAIIVIVFSVVLILLVGIICCCTNRRIEKELRKLEKGATGV
jgi:hypothetical protein